MPDTPSKKELRSQFKAARMALSPEELDQKSKAIFRNFVDNFSLEKVEYLHIFLSIRKFNEVDTEVFRRFFDSIHPQIKVVIPVTDPVKNVLKHVWLHPEIQLVENSWGIPEPKVGKSWISPSAIDMVLVPLLAFDPTGHRIGYGKGFYDGFLSETKATCKKIGLSFETGRSSQTFPAEPHDIPLDSVVTEQGVFHFND